MLAYEAFLEFLERGRHLGLQFVVEGLLFANLLKDAGMRVLHEFIELPLKWPALLDRQVVEGAAGAGIDGQDLLLDRHRAVLPLLEDLGEALPASELLLRGLVQLRAELGEGRERAVLRQLEPQ